MKICTASNKELNCLETRYLLLIGNVLYELIKENDMIVKNASCKICLVSSNKINIKKKKLVSNIISLRDHC